MEETQSSSAPERTPAPTPTESPVAPATELPSATSGNRSFLTVVAAAVAGVIAIGGYLYYNQSTSEDGIVTSFEAVTPTQVVARVNGTEINGAKLLPQISLISEQGGQPDPAELTPEEFAIVKDQALDSVINSELVSQSAKDSGTTVSDEEVEETFAEIVAQVGGSAAATERLSALGVSEAEFKATLADDLVIQKYVEAKEGLTVTEEEVRAFYATATGGASEGVPAFEDVSFQIEQQLLFQKQQEALLELVEELRAGADIEILI